MLHANKRALSGLVGLALLLILTASRLPLSTDLAFWSKGRRFLPSVSSPLSTCAPYEVSGILQLHNESEKDGRWELNRYEPFDGCKPVDYVKAIRRQVQRLPGDEDIDWLKDKTFVLLGDSQDRYFVRDFCEVLGLQPEVIFANDSRTPALPPGLAGSQFIPNGTQFPNADGWGRPNVCNVQELNLTFVTMYHWSLSTAEEIYMAWHLSEKQFNPPHETLDRYHHTLLPLMKNLGRNIDVFQFASFNWDLLGLRIRQSTREGAWYYKINVTDLHVYEERLFDMLMRLDERLPRNVPFYFRLPQPQEEAAPTISIIGAAMTQSIYRTLQRATGRDWRRCLSYEDRKQKLEDVVKTAPLHNRLRPIGAGPLMQGYADYFRDALHPGMTQNYVQANVLLHEWVHVLPYERLRMDGADSPF